VIRQFLLSREEHGDAVGIGGEGRALVEEINGTIIERQLVLFTSGQF